MNPRIFKQPSQQEWKNDYQKFAEEYDKLAETREFAGGDDRQALTGKKLVEEATAEKREQAVSKSPR